ncbi:MAG: hypothetical protein HY905_20425 [Deltaproteobacteria bacterium]|nr:hypothetical protein [Deltaproteobacteria bacterium]
MIEFPQRALAVPAVVCGWPLVVLLACGCGPAARGPAAGGPGTQPGGTALVVTPEAGAERGPGRAVPSPDDEALVASAVVAVVSGNIDAASGLFSDSIVVGPALWALLQDDPALAGIGLPTTMHVATADGYVELDGRTFLDADRGALLKSDRFRAVLARAGSDGAPRAATDAERALFYMLIPFEIAGEPLTVIGAGATVTVLGTSDGGLFWLDVLGAYGGGGSASSSEDDCAGDPGPAITVEPMPAMP